MKNRFTGMNRRKVLHLIWLGTIGLAAAGLAAIGMSFALPRIRKGEFGGLILVGPLTELPAVGDPPVNHPKGKFWLVHTQEGLLALYKACTHLDCMFDWNAQEQRFICPCHGSQFERNGKVLTGPAPRSLDRFVIQIVSPQGKILSQTDPVRGNPLAVPAAVKTQAETADASNSNAGSPQPDAMVRVDTSRRISGTALDT